MMLERDRKAARRRPQGDRGAADAAALEELRVRYLGRKSELTEILRGIGELPADERGPVGTAGNEARQALERRSRTRRAELDASELEDAARRGRDRRHPARDAAGRRRAPAPAHPHPARDRGRLRRARLPGDGGARGRARLLQLHRAQPPARATRRGWSQDTFYVDPGDPARPARSLNERRRCRRGPRTSSCAPTPRRCRSARWRPRRRRSSSSCPGRCYRRDPFDATHTPMFPQVEGLAVGDGISLADLAGTLEEAARALFGPERETRLQPGLLPVHRAQRPGRRLLLRCGGTRRARRRLARPALQGQSAGSRSSARGWSTRTSSASSRDERLRPRASPGLRLRDGDRADRDAQARRPRPAQVLRERRPGAGAVPMRVPDCWLREYCDPGLSPSRSSPTALDARASRSSGSRSVGAPSARRLRGRQGALGREASRRRPAQRLRGRHRRRRRARSSAAPRTSPPGRRSRWRCPAP